MFFSGDPSTRKRVDLGGRSSKERDRQKLLEQTRLERNRRLWLRQQNSAALKIQVRFLRDHTHTFNLRILIFYCRIYSTFYHRAHNSIDNCVNSVVTLGNAYELPFNTINCHVLCLIPIKSWNWKRLLS